MISPANRSSSCIDTIPIGSFRQFPLRVILLPHVSEHGQSMLHHASEIEALRALAPSTIFQRTGAGNEVFEALAGLVRQVPCYHLALGRDMERIPRLIAGLLRGS